MRSYSKGLDVLGARTKQTLVGTRRKHMSGRSTLGPRGRVTMLGAASSWDNTQSYPAGSYCYNDGHYYRALRDVTPPFLPSLMSGDVPGESDAWREVSAAEATGNPNVSGDLVEMLGDEIVKSAREILGMFDITQAKRNMNDLAPVTVEIARILLRGGQEAIDGAIAGAKQPWYKADLPGNTARDNVRGHLQWHASKLATTSRVNEPQTNYASGEDLKKWTMEAYIEANAVEEGAAYIDASWNAMWNEIETKLAAIPRTVAHALIDTAGKTAGAILGVPPWAVYVGGAVVLGGVGYLAYKIVTGPVGGAVAHHYLGRYR